MIDREIARLKAAGAGVARKRILEHEYERHKSEAALRAQRQGLLLHGLSDTEINRILESRTLQQTMTVRTPELPDDTDEHQREHQFHIQSISVRRGQHVNAGDTLGVLADHCFLYVELLLIWTIKFTHLILCFAWFLKQAMLLNEKLHACGNYQMRLKVRYRLKSSSVKSAF